MIVASRRYNVQYCSMNAKKIIKKKENPDNKRKNKIVH